MSGSSNRRRDSRRPSKNRNDSMRDRDAQRHRDSRGAGSDPDHDEDEFLFSDLAVDPPLVEFQRVCEKKERAFETSEDQAHVDRYRKAFALGEEKLRALLGEEGEC